MVVSRSELASWKIEQQPPLPTHCLLGDLDAHHLLPTTHYLSLPSTYSPPLPTHCLLGDHTATWMPTTCYLPPSTSHYLPPTTHHYLPTALGDHTATWMPPPPPQPQP